MGTDLRKNNNISKKVSTAPIKNIKFKGCCTYSLTKSSAANAPMNCERYNNAITNALVCSYDVIIAGAGPAGLTAALYCGRSKLRTKLFDISEPGGQVNITEDIENYPGLRNANARTFVSDLTSQVKELPDVELQEFRELTQLRCENNLIVVNTQSSVDEKTAVYGAKALIIATGAHPKQLELPGIQELRGRGVSYCAVCDGPFFRDKEVAVIGGGDTSLKEALYLTKFAKKVYVVHRRLQLRGAGILQGRLADNARIELVLNSVPTAIIGKERVEKLRVEDVATKQQRELDCSGVFIFVGYTPDTGFAEGVLELDKEKYIITDEEMKTSQKGIFACGDCRKRPFRQIVTACGEGAVAAHMAERYITEGV